MTDAERKEKRRIYHAKYYIENSDKYKAREIKYRNTEKCKTTKAKYRAEHKEQMKAYHAKYQTENKEKIKARGAKYYAANTEKVKLQRENAKRICKCDICGKEILRIPSRIDAVNYCVKHAAEKASKTSASKPRVLEGTYIACKYCGKEMYIQPYEKQTNRFCSGTCWGKWKSENMRGDMIWNYANGGLAKDPAFRVIHDNRRRINRALNGHYHTEDLEKILGCTVAEFKTHIESQMESWMTWENHGMSTWHLDHIIPVSSYSGDVEIKKVMNYRNMRPLSAEENKAKRDTLYMDLVAEYGIEDLLPDHAKAVDITYASMI